MSISTNAFSRQFYLDMIHVKNEYLYSFVFFSIVRKLSPCLLLVLVAASFSISLLCTFAISFIILYSMVNLMSLYLVLQHLKEI